MTLIGVFLTGYLLAGGAADQAVGTYRALADRTGLNFMAAFFTISAFAVDTLGRKALNMGQVSIFAKH